MSERNPSEAYREAYKAAVDQTAITQALVSRICEIARTLSGTHGTDWKRVALELGVGSGAGRQFKHTAKNSKPLSLLSLPAAADVETAIFEWNHKRDSLDELWKMVPVADQGTLRAPETLDL